MTLRELWWMAEGRRLEEWDQTSLLAAVTHNAFLVRSSDARAPMEFHPYRAARKAAKPQRKGDIRILKELFVDRPVF